MTRATAQGGWPAALVAALLLAGCTASSAPTTPTTPSSARPDPTPTSSPEATAAPRELLTDVGRAATASAAELRTAAAGAVAGSFAELVQAPWPSRVRDELPSWPVHVGTATLGLDGDVELDLVLAAPPDDDGQLVLRWLPAAPALGDAVHATRVHVDGAEVEARVDAAGARLLVPVPVETPAAVRVQASYTVPDRDALQGEGPAGFGLLARTPEAVMLGHWLPLLALPGDDGPMLARGDVGGFPPGVFSLVVEHEGALVTGGDEQRCPDRGTGCTWVRGVGLRDVAAVLLADARTATVTGHTGTTAAVAAPPSTVGDGAAALAAEQAAEMLGALGDELGALPWSTVDVVAAPLSPGALGMEFPGIVWVDPSAWPTRGPGLGAHVLAHEVGHQWFHALVGNGSLSAPVVDESLAQYLSVVAFDAVFGDGSGAALAARSLGGRHETAVEEGVPDEAPAQPLSAFATARSYGANVYGRGGQAWVEAEEVAGRDAVLAALRTLVERHGLREVDAATVLDVVREVAPAAAEPLADGWGLSGGG